MVLKYLIANYENGKNRYFPCHPLSERVFLVDGEFIPAMTEDDTPSDFVLCVVDPSITDKVKNGADLKPMGTPPPHDGLSAARFAQNFVDAFNAAGMRSDSSAVPADPVEPSKPAEPVEPSKPE